MKLDGKTVLVTGGSGGFGKGLAHALVEKGAHVFITGRNTAKLAAAAHETGAVAIAADATRADDWDRVLAEVGELDVLVNNAGAGVRIAPLAEQTDAEIVAGVNVNLTGALLGCARAARTMGARGSGAIVNVSSVCAYHAWPGWSVYTAAKAGLVKFSHALHTELRPKGVRVFCVAPSWGRTDFDPAAGIVGAAEDPALAPQLIAPEDFARLVISLLELPDHLVVPELAVQPMVQDICPM